MKLAGLVIVALVCFQDAFAQKCKAGNAAPWVCECEFLSHNTKDPDTATVDAGLVPLISQEEFDPRVSGDRHRKSNGNFLDYCQNQCLNRLRVRLLQENIPADMDEKHPGSTLLENSGKDVLCDLLYNGMSEVEDVATAVMGTGDTRHYWLRVFRRECPDPHRDVYLGANSCKCYDIVELSLQKCFTMATVTGYTAGADTTPDVVRV